MKYCWSIYLAAYCPPIASGPPPIWRILRLFGVLGGGSKWDLGGISPPIFRLFSRQNWRITPLCPGGPAPHLFVIAPSALVARQTAVTHRSRSSARGIARFLRQLVVCARSPPTRLTPVNAIAPWPSPCSAPRWSHLSPISSRLGFVLY